MSRRINFFATEKDMVSLLKEVEETIPFDVKYILSYYQGVRLVFW